MCGASEEALKSPPLVFLLLLVWSLLKMLMMIIPSKASSTVEFLNEAAVLCYWKYIIFNKKYLFSNTLKFITTFFTYCVLQSSKSSSDLHWKYKRKLTDAVEKLLPRNIYLQLKNWHSTFASLCKAIVKWMLASSSPGNDINKVTTLQDRPCQIIN